jgi:hypothetical protein
MPIAVIYRPPAMTAEQYQESWIGGVPVDLPRGLVFHTGIGDGDAFLTVSVWEDRAAYDAFAPVFAKAMAERGLHFGKPEILSVHQVLSPR